LDLPNSTTFSKLYLSEVFYCSEIGYTLVSIGQLNDASFSTTFANRRCIIYDAGGSCIAEVPQNGKGLYKLVRKVEEVNVVNESLTLDLLHQWLGHIAHSAAQKLVCDGLVTGLELKESRKTNLFCESCTYGKMTQVPIFKVQESERAKVFCKEVYSDVWGPAQVETKKERCYYVTFTDDYLWWTHVDFLVNKSAVLTSYKAFNAMCKTQHSI